MAYWAQASSKSANSPASIGLVASRPFLRTKASELGNILQYAYELELPGGDPLASETGAASTREYAPTPAPSPYRRVPNAGSAISLKRFLLDGPSCFYVFLLNVLVMIVSGACLRSDFQAAASDSTGMPPGSSGRSVRSREQSPRLEDRTLARPASSSSAPVRSRADADAGLEEVEVDVAAETARGRNIRPPRPANIPMPWQTDLLIRSAQRGQSIVPKNSRANAQKSAGKAIIRREQRQRQGTIRSPQPEQTRGRRRRQSRG